MANKELMYVLAKVAIQRKMANMDFGMGGGGGGMDSGGAGLSLGGQPSQPAGGGMSLGGGSQMPQLKNSLGQPLNPLGAKGGMGGAGGQAMSNVAINAKGPEALQALTQLFRMGAGGL